MGVLQTIPPKKWFTVVFAMPLADSTPSSPWEKGKRLPAMNFASQDVIYSDRNTSTRSRMEVTWVSQNLGHIASPKKKCATQFDPMPITSSRQKWAATKSQALGTEPCLGCGWWITRISSPRPHQWPCASSVSRLDQSLNRLFSQDTVSFQVSHDIIIHISYIPSGKLT